MIFDRFKDKVAIIPLEGPIMEGQGMSIFSTLMRSSISKVEDYLKRVENNDKYKGLILDINSPGGSPYKSKKLANKVEKLKIFKVARVGEYCTSGAYWVASACDRIVADELSNVGGIGTISIRPDFSNFLENLGIKMDIEGKGKYKDQGLPFSKVTEEERERREQVIEEINDMFVEYIKRRRKIDSSSEALEGKVFLGREAKKKGLVDNIGDIDTAIKLLEHETGFKNLVLKDFRKELEKGHSLLDLLR